MRFSMPMPRNLLLAIVTSLLVVSTPGAVWATAIYRGPVDKPADPFYTYNKTVFDCSPPDSLTLLVGTQIALSDSTNGRGNQINSYPCQSWAEKGSEFIYRLNIASEMRLSATIAVNVPDSVEFVIDFDIFLLDDCDSDACLVGANIALGIDLQPGIYYLVIDADTQIGAAEGPFTLSLETRAFGIPPAACANATPLTCSPQTPAIADESLLGQPNLVQEDDCGTSPKTGGEIWYQITLPPDEVVTVNAVNVAIGLDVNFWVYDQCGENATCLQFVDDNVASLGETMILANETAADLTYYFAVDTTREPSDMDSSLYTLQISCESNVPSERTSFGGLKSLYR